jgi:hypothetical protein
VGDEDGGMAVTIPEFRLRLSADECRDPSTHVADVRGSLPEVVVVHGRQVLRLLVGRSQDRLVGGGAGLDEGKRRAHDPRVASEQRLGLEDRADVRAGTGGELGGQVLEL